MAAAPFKLARIPAVAALLSAAVPALGAPGDPEGPETRLLSGGQPFFSSVAATDAQGNLVALSGATGLRFSPAGVPIGTPFAVGAAAGAIAMEPNGDFAVAWRTGIVGQALWTRCFAADGAPKGDAQQVFAAKDLLGSFDIAMDADGDFAVAYDDTARTPLVPGLGYLSPLLLTQNIRVQRYSGACAPVGRPSIVAQRVGGPIGDIGETQLAMSGAGDFVVVWVASGTANPGIISRSYRANGVAKGLARTVTTSLNAFEPAIAMAADGRHAVTWRGYPGGAPGASILVRLYGANGFATGPAFQANEPATDSRFQPAIGMSADGHFVVAWTTNPVDDTHSNDVYARRFAPDGSPLAGEFLAPAFPAFTQNSSQVLVDPGGHFTLLWQGRNADGEGTFVRRFEGP